MRRGCFYMSVSTVYLSLSLPNNKIKKKETSYVLFLPQHCSGYCSNLENKRIRREIISNFRPFSSVKCCDNTVVKSFKSVYCSVLLTKVISNDF